MNLNVSLQDTILGLLFELRSHVLEATWVSHIYKSWKKIIASHNCYNRREDFY